MKGHIGSFNTAKDYARLKSLETQEDVGVQTLFFGTLMPCILREVLYRNGVNVGENDYIRKRYNLHVD